MIAASSKAPLTNLKLYYLEVNAHQLICSGQLYFMVQGLLLIANITDIIASVDV